MSEDFTDLWTAVLADPDNETLLLAVADWLEENRPEKGEVVLGKKVHPRAELIRTQIAVRRFLEDDGPRGDCPMCGEPAPWVSEHYRVDRWICVKRIVTPTKASELLRRVPVRFSHQLMWSEWDGPLEWVACFLGPTRPSPSSWTPTPVERMAYSVTVRRGVVREIADITWKNWLRIHNAVFWHPDQKVLSEESVFTPRPLTPYLIETVQPITDVILEDRPPMGPMGRQVSIYSNSNRTWYVGDADVNDNVLMFDRGRPWMIWPGVRFHLPKS